MKLQELYNKVKESKVGDKCKCPSCGTEFIKGSYQQIFCKTKSGTKCKDKFWNTIDPKKRNNKSRISPASRRFMLKQAALAESRPKQIKVRFGVWHDDEWCESS